MEDNMNMNEEIKINELDTIDKKTATMILNKVGEAIINEYESMQVVLQSTKDNAIDIDRQLEEIEKEIDGVNKDIEVQIGIIDSLEHRMKSETEEAVIKSLMGIRDETVARMEQLKSKLDEYADQINKVKTSMCKIKESELYLTISSEALISFGMKYGLVSENKE